jgi:hypothetical protein
MLGLLSRESDPNGPSVKYDDYYGSEHLPVVEQAVAIVLERPMKLAAAAVLLVRALERAATSPRAFWSSFPFVTPMWLCLRWQMFEIFGGALCASECDNQIYVCLAITSLPLMLCRLCMWLAREEGKASAVRP